MTVATSELEHLQLRGELRDFRIVSVMIRESAKKQQDSSFRASSSVFTDATDKVKTGKLRERPITQAFFFTTFSAKSYEEIFRKIELQPKFLELWRKIVELQRKTVELWRKIMELGVKYLQNSRKFS